MNPQQKEHKKNRPFRVKTIKFLNIRCKYTNFLQIVVPLQQNFMKYEDNK